MRHPQNPARTLKNAWQMCRRLFIACALLLSVSPLHAQQMPTISETIAGATPMEGYFNMYWDDATGAMYWEIDKLDTEFLYQVSMGSGLGSNPVGIDRGQLRGPVLGGRPLT
mgnify:FL=1